MIDTSLPWNLHAFLTEHASVTLPTFILYKKYRRHLRIVISCKLRKTKQEFFGALKIHRGNNLSSRLTLLFEARSSGVVLYYA